MTTLEARLLGCEQIVCVVDQDATDTLYVEALATPDTIDTTPLETPLAFVRHGVFGGVLAVDGRKTGAMPAGGA